MDTMQICSYIWTIFIVVWLVAWFKTKRTQERVNLESRLRYSIPVFLGCYFLFDDRFSGWLQERVLPKNIWIESLAIFITAAGIGFAIWARFYLGDNWSSAVSIKVDHELIRTSPYAWVRHPIYTGILLGMIGTALARREPRGLVAVIFLWIGFWIKSRMEEVFMRKTFGEQYQEYSRTTGALIPRVRL